MYSFSREIEVMKSVPKHANILGIIGHYTKDVCSMMLVTEYCDRGNLLNFLQYVNDCFHLYTSDAYLLFSSEMFTSNCQVWHVIQNHSCCLETHPVNININLCMK